MSTQTKNVVELPVGEKYRNGIERAADTVSGTVESFVDSLHSAAVLPVEELAAREPIIKPLAVGYIAGVLSILIGVLAAGLTK